MNVVAGTDLLFPGRQNQVGQPSGFHYSPDHLRFAGADPHRYVAWVNPGRLHAPDSLPELAPRIALHLVECRNGAHP